MGQIAHVYGGDCHLARKIVLGKDWAWGKALPAGGDAKVYKMRLETEEGNYDSTRHKTNFKLRS